MNSVIVARKDFEDVVRSKLIWMVLGLFVFLMGIIVFAGANLGEEEIGTDAFVGLFADLGAWLMVPLIAVMLGYMAIVGERQSGSLRVLSGLGLGRADILTGKITSRALAMTVVTVVAMVVGLAMTLAVGAAFDAWLFARFAGLTLLLALMFTSIAVAISATTATRYRAMGGALGAYLLFAILWHPIAAGIHYVIKGALPVYEAPTWYFLLTRLNPLEAYNQVISVWIDQYVWGLFGWVNIVENLDGDVSDPQYLLLTNRVEGELPFYLTDWFAAVILLAWIVVPLAVAYWRFGRVDLN